MPAIHYVLIDFENVQPKNLDILKQHPFKILVFVGENQARIPFDMAEALQGFGKDARYVKISGNGQNALDFHLAYYLGRVSVDDSDAVFHIVSRDKGFDPLVRHLRSQKITVNRVSDLAEIPVLRMPKAADTDAKIKAIVKNLSGRGQSRPRKLTTLINTITSLFTPRLSDAEVKAVIETLQARNLITVNQDNIAYHLPKETAAGSG